MKSIGRGRATGALIAGAALGLAACGGIEGKREGQPAIAPAPAPMSNVVSDTPVKIGDPFTVAGVTYTPADIADYDEVGYASWYGEEASGNQTANGEIFDPDGISAAHKTLPLPSYVEVTALDTGRTILVRINDRGPMANDRLIDLSRGAAAQLGITDGVKAVRIRRTNPPAAERAQLRAGRAVPERMIPPETLLSLLNAKMKNVPFQPPAAGLQPEQEPAPPAASGHIKPGDDRMSVSPSKPPAKPMTKPPAVTGSLESRGGRIFVVQVGAFSDEARAKAVAAAVGGRAIRARTLWRVRIGPFGSISEARRALNQAKAKGFGDTQVMRDR